MSGFLNYSSSEVITKGFEASLNLTTEPGVTVHAACIANTVRKHLVLLMNK